MQKQRQHPLPPSQAKGEEADVATERQSGSTNGGAARAALERDHKLGLGCDQVMHGCGFSDRRLRCVIRAQLEHEDDCGEPVQSAALAMIDAWKYQEAQGERLRVRLGPRKFFDQGYWKNRNGWHWDYEVLNFQSDATVGLARGG